MSKVDIVHPRHGSKTVSRVTLATWRKQGWVLEEDAPKSPKEGLKQLRESKQDEVPDKQEEA